MRMLWMCLLLLLSACEQVEQPVAVESAQRASEAPGAVVEAAPSGEAAYLQNCAACHDQTFYKAPSRLFVSMMGAKNILAAMENGLMAELASTLDAETRRAVAEFLSGESLDKLEQEKMPPSCGDSHGFDASQPPVSVGWGVDHSNSRFQPAESAGISLEDIANLEVKWSFAYPNAIKARSQPVFGGGAIYFGSQDGTVRALDAKTGCLRWTFKASAEVRNALVISPWSAGEPQVDPVLYFGDILARAYALKARTGELLWMSKVDEHRDATITGAPALVGDRLFVPVSSLEVVAAMSPQYACCTFRGSVVALDVANGQQIWKTYTIDEEPVDAGTTSAGTAILAPSGAPVWTSPTVDKKRGLLYIGTGENYSSPADGNSDAIIALDMHSGEKKWVSQQTSGDAWNTGCLIEFTTDDANCPEENGPDYDFGSSPILVKLADGSDVLIGGQKSAAAMAIDPDTGKTLWKTQIGRGGVQGGVHFGMAVEGERVYVPINDMAYPEDITRYKFTVDAKPGLYAINAVNGELIWSTPAPEICGDMKNCDAGISHAIAAIPGAVIAGHMDGRLRIYSGGSGEILWELNTLQDFDTVSGERARGGSFSGGGPIVAHGMIYVNSGYGIYNHMPGNVLLAIGPATE